MSYAGAVGSNKSISSSKIIYKNCTGSTAEILYSKNDLQDNKIKTITLVNIHATDSVNIDLYLDTTESPINLGGASSHPAGSYRYSEQVQPERNIYYLYKAVVLPIGVTLQLESKDIYIDYQNSIYDLYIKLSAADSAVDVIINS